MTVLATFLAVWLVMVASPETPVARLLRRCLVERVAAMTVRVTRGHLALAALLGLVASVVVWFGEADGLRMAAMAAPEVATWITTFEIATVVDVTIGAAAAWAVLRAGSIPFLAALVRRPSARRRQRATRTRAPRTTDDDCTGSLPLAA